MGKEKKTYFSNLWLSNPEYSWVGKGKQDTTYLCKLCKKENALGSMGEGALKIHAEGVKHKGYVSAEEMKKRFFVAKKSNSSDQTGEASSSKEVEVTDLDKEDPNKEDPEGKENGGQQSIEEFVTLGTTMEAEVRWVLYCVKHNFSDASQQDFVPTVQVMFPDSKIASGMKLGKDKVKRMVNHGFYPYFKERVLEMVLKSAKFVVSFDESLNKVTQTSQMDINLRYWDVDAMRVEEIYWHSSFLGKTGADDLIKHFTDALEKFDLSRMIQIGMDGPTTNWSFMKKLNAAREKDELPGLIDIGSCNLHIIHGAFKTGAESTNWNIAHTLKGAFHLLHDTPSRRATYANLGGTEYPQFFCATRWIEDEPVADRLVHIWPHMIKLIDYFEGLVPSKRPSCKSYERVKVAVEDNLTIARLKIFMYIAGLLQPLLAFYQSNVPLLPFMYPDIKAMLKTLLAVIIKPTLLKDSSSAAMLLKIDLNKEDNLLKVDDIHLGFAAEEEARKQVQKDTVKKKQVRELREQTQVFVRRIVQKIAERSPLTSVIIRNAVVFDPRNMAASGAETLIKKLKPLTQKLVELRIINFQTANKALMQYRLLLGKEVIMSKDIFLNFNSREDRVDEFFFHKIGVHKNYPELSSVIIIILILSSGQAFTERGFSVNKPLLKVNMKDDTVVARRFVKSYLNNKDVDPHTIAITSAMVKEVKKANMRYTIHLEEEKNKMKLSRENTEKQKICSELRSISENCELLTETVKALNQKFVELAKKAEEKNNLQFLTEGNAMKRKAEEKTELLEALVRRKEELMVQKQKFH